MFSIKLPLAREKKSSLINKGGKISLRASLLGNSVQLFEDACHFFSLFVCV